VDTEEDEGSDQETPPEEDFPSATFNQDKQVADTIYNVGIMMGASEKPLFERIPATVIDQVGKLFLPPPHFSKTRLSGRTIVVAGPTHSGKFFCSVKLATILQKNQPPGPTDSTGSIFLYSRLRHETAPLLQALASLKEGSVLILEDAFAKNVSERELASNELIRLNAALAARRSFLILTTDMESPRIETPVVLTRNLDLKKVFEKHVLFYLPADKPVHKDVLGLIRSHKEALVGLFKSPFQIESFFQKLRVRPALSERELQKLAQEAARSGRQDLRGWFDGLPNHAKLIGLLACLLEGIEELTIEKLFVESVSRLRAHGFGWIADVREFGLREVWSLLRVTPGIPHIHFEQKSIREELEWQVENRHLLLWSVMQPIAADAGLWREDVRARAILGAAIGWLGTWDEVRFRTTVESWAHARNYLAEEPDNAMGSLPGYAFVENLLSDPMQGRSRVLKILYDWIGSHDPDLLWAAGAAIWRLYQMALSKTDFDLSDQAPKMSRDLIAGLHSLVASAGSLAAPAKAKIRAHAEALSQRNQQNAGAKERVAALRKEKEAEVKRQLWNCATFALKRIGEVDTKQFATTLAKWFDEDSQVFGWIASRAAMFTFLDLAGWKDEPDTLDAEFRLNLIDVVLAKKSRESRVVESMFGWLERWAGWSEWQSLIRQHLLGIANRGPRALRGALRSALAQYWLSSATEGIPEIALSLIARSYAMEGVLSEPPKLGHCLLIVDPELIQGRALRKAQGSESERQAERRQGSILQILAMVEAQMDVSVLLLGALAATQRTERGLRLTPDLPLHRLMIPGAEKVAPEGAQLVLVLTGGPVVDLEDGLDAMSVDHKLVVAAGCEPEVPLGTELLSVGRELSTRDLETVETKIRLIYTRAQAALDPAGWDPLLERLGVCIADLDANPEASLTGWARQLGDFAGASGRTDLPKIILCVLFRLAAADLDACLRIVRRWLTEGTDLERPMATAAGFALFGTVSDVPDAWGGLAPQRIFDELAEPLARSGKDGTDTLLRTAERWLAEPGLAEILAGGVEDGRCRLLRWAERAAPHQLEAFRQALDRLPKAINKEDLGPTGEALAAAFDRLRVRLAMGRPRPLPDLADGESFGVIVFDASARAGSRSSWAPLATALFSRFNRPPSGSLKPLLYRLGERWPAWVAGDPNPIPADLSPGGVRLPRLLGPILAGLSPVAVSFLIVVSDEIWIDGEDWIEDPWRERIFTLRQLQGAPYRPVLAAIPHLQGLEKEEVDLMARYLIQPHLEGGEVAA